MFLSVGDLTAVGRLIGSVHTIVVPVTNPHPGDAALADGTLELVGGTCHFRCTRDNQLRLFTSKLQRNIAKLLTHFTKENDYSACGTVRLQYSLHNNMLIFLFSQPLKGLKMLILTLTAVYSLCNVPLWRMNVLSKCHGNYIMQRHLA